MRILYGIQGTGNGHLRRSSEIIRHLTTLGHKVTPLVSGRHGSLSPQQWGLPPTIMKKGLTFALIDGQVRWWLSLRQLHLSEFVHDVRTLPLNQYDLIISDFEPVTAWAARFGGRRCIGIGHQFSFYRDRQGRSAPGMSSVARRSLALLCPVSDCIGYHWAPYGDHIFPPLASPSPPAAITKALPGKVLVYLPHTSVAKIQQVLRPLTRYEFHLFSPHYADCQYGQLVFHRSDVTRFREHFRQSEAVITHAGFELCSESLRDGKKLIMVPLRGHIEQNANALAAAHLNLAAVIPELVSSVVEKALMAQHSPHRMPSLPISDLAYWIHNGAEANEKVRLWQNVWQSFSRTPT